MSFHLLLMLQLKTSAGIFLQTSGQDSCPRLPDYSQGGINQGLACQQVPQVWTWRPYCAHVALFIRPRWPEHVQVTCIRLYGGKPIAWHTYIKTSVCRSHWPRKALALLLDCIVVVGQAHSSHCRSKGALCLLESQSKNQILLFPPEQRSFQ